MTRDQRFEKLWDFLEKAKKDILTKALIFLGSSWFVIAYLVSVAEAANKDGNIKGFTDALWWGIVTFLTVGYGDRFPTTPEGRLLGGTLMIIGMVTISIVTAKISSYFLEQVLKEERGIVNTEELKGHYIVCGFKDDIDSLLLHILDLNKGLTAERIVLIAHLQTDDLTALKAHKRLKNLKIIIGDYTQEAILKSAAPERAKRVLILADRAQLPNGQIPSMKETDARTLMTAMVLSHAARGVPVSAEILDPTMEGYMRMAHVSEVLLSREYNRLLLANATGESGISNVIYELLNPQTPTVINAISAPEDLVGKSYLEFKETFEKRNQNIIVIGVLENVGNSFARKELALRQAQKTADMNLFVKNLKAVKNLRFNHPVLNPGKDYVVSEGCAAIVIETREVAV